MCRKRIDEIPAGHTKTAASCARRCPGSADDQCKIPNTELLRWAHLCLSKKIIDVKNDERHALLSNNNLLEHNHNNHEVYLLETKKRNILLHNSKNKHRAYLGRGSLEYRIKAGISCLGFKLRPVEVHASTVSFASNIINSGANLYCTNLSLVKGNCARQLSPPNNIFLSASYMIHTFWHITDGNMELIFRTIWLWHVDQEIDLETYK